MRTRSGWSSLRRSSAGRTNRGSAALLQRLREMDTNKDLKLQKEEIPRALRPFIGRADKNKDGALDLTELSGIDRSALEKLTSGKGLPK